MRLWDGDSGVSIVNPENRIFSWKSIPRSSRIILITTMIIVVLITPNLAEGYYESSWEQIEKNTFIPNAFCIRKIAEETFNENPAAYSKNHALFISDLKGRISEFRVVE